MFMRPKKKILLVDSNAVTRGCLSLLLYVNGYSVTEASTFAEAMTLAQLEPFDVFVSDLVLGFGEDGNILARQLKLLFPEARVLLFSATVKSYDRASNADFFLTRTKSAEFLEAVKLVAARKRGPKKAAALNPVEVAA